MKLRAVIVAAIAAAGLCWPLASQQPKTVGPEVPKITTSDAAMPVPKAPQLDAANVEAWLDGYIPAHLKQGKIAGAVVSVVKDGQILVSKGYGYADVASRKPMDGHRTLVRIGSTGKLFTWTAVMQLVEQGKLDLDRDVNAYLDFKIPQRFGRPITLNDLMTHRAGFEEGLKDVLANDPAHLNSNERILKEHPRPVLYPPGDVPAYSNYGAGLAGYIVERVSGEPYDQYVERHIFAPLRMQRSSTRQPLPEQFKADMSQGYISSIEAPRPYELIATIPAGSASNTAADMANFMVAFLQQGAFGDGRILKPETARFMQSPSLASREGFATMAHGFFYDRRNGRLVIGHGGDTILFHTDLSLIPEERVGLFVSFNSRGAGDSAYLPRDDLIKDFIDRYFPAPASDPPTLPTAREHAAEIAGPYESSRRVESGFLAFLYLLEQVGIVANDDGTISLSSGDGEKFREVAPHVWRETGGDHQLALTHVNGRKTILDSEDPTAVLHSLPFWRSSQFTIIILFGSLIILLWTLLAWPGAAILRRVYGQARALSGRSLTLYRLTEVAVLAVVIYAAAWYFTLAPILDNWLGFYTSALDPWIRTLQIAAILPVLGLLVASWNVWLAIEERRGWPAIIGSILVAMAMSGLLWVVYLGGLMSWNLNY